KNGAPTHPDWYHNLVAHPDVTVEVGTDIFAARATVVDGAERDELFASMAAMIPVYAEYQAQITRTIPVVVLTSKEQRPSLSVSSTLSLDGAGDVTIRRKMSG